METLPIFLCIVIGYAFAGLQRVEIGEDDLKPREEDAAKGFRTPNVKETVNIDQCFKSKYVPEIVHSMTSVAKPSKETDEKEDVAEDEEEEEVEEEEEEENEKAGDEVEDNEDEDKKLKDEIEEEKEEQKEENEVEEAKEKETEDESKREMVRQKKKKDEHKRVKRAQNKKMVSKPINKKKIKKALVGPKKKPVVNNKIMVGQKKKPVVNNKIMVGQKKKPVVNNKIMVGQKKKPVVNNKIMVGQKKKPVVNNKIMVGQKKKPAVNNKITVEQKKKPVANKKKMVVQQTKTGGKPSGNAGAQVGEDNGDKYVGIDGAKVERGMKQASHGEAGNKQRDKETNAPPFCGKLDILMTPAQIKEMVDSHNEARRRERATDMLKLVWDETLAKVAQQKANTCIYGHSMLWDCKGRQVGQSLWALSNSVGTYYEKVNITQITYGWADERNDWDWNTMKCNDGKKCGHWQMLAGAKVWRLGCGLARCNKLWAEGSYRGHALFSVCNYLPYHKTFERGEHCSNCAKSTAGLALKGWTCQNKLCVQCDPKKKKGCKTGTGEIEDDNI